MKASIITEVFDRGRSGRVLLSPLRLMMLFILFAASGYGATNYYVWRDNPDPISPFTNWAMAATSIQDAVDLTIAGDTIYVTNGIYDTGGKVTPGYALTNRVCITKAITLISTNGPAVTIIRGGEALLGGNGDGAVRCVYLTNGASLAGFTLTNGHTMLTGNYHYDDCGGGVFCNYGGVVSNCLITGNSSGLESGGAHFYYGGTLNNCTVSGNTAPNSASGGAGNVGTGIVTLNNCVFSGNTAYGPGGASCLSYNFKVINCVFSGNAATNREGGGVYFYSSGSGGALSNCTVVGNTCRNGGGGVSFKSNCVAVVNNCIVWGNSSTYNEQNIRTNSISVVRYTCSNPQPDGDGNIGLDPQFVNTNAGNYRLRANSPCVNRGTNANWMLNGVDLDGRARIRYGTVDMGAYEEIYEGTFYRIP